MFAFIRKSVFVLCLLLATVTQVAAQPAVSEEAVKKEAAERMASSEVINLKDYLPELVKTHDRILAAAARVETARQQIQVARSGVGPKLDFYATGGYENIQRPIDISSDFMKNTQSLRLTQWLWDFGNRLTQIDKSRDVAELTDKSMVAIKQEVINEGVASFLNCLRQYTRLGYAVQSEDSIKKQTGVEEAMVKRGAGLATDVLLAKQQLAGANALRILVDGELANSQNRFRAVYDFPVTVDEISRFKNQSLPYEYIPGTLDEAVNIAFRDNPQLQAASKYIDIANKDITIAESRYYPSFQIVAERRRRENDVGVSGVRHETSALLEMNYNLFNSLGDLAADRAAQYNLVAAKRDVLDLRRTVQEQVRVAWQNVLTLKANAEYLRLQSDINYENLELFRDQRRREQVSVLDVLTTEVNYINSVSAAVSAETDTLLAAYNLLLAMGQLDLDKFEK